MDLHYDYIISWRRRRVPWLEVVALQQTKTKSQDRDHYVCLEEHSSVDVASEASFVKSFPSLVHYISLVDFSGPCLCFSELKSMSSILEAVTIVAALRYLHRPPDSMCSIERIRYRPSVRYNANRRSSTVVLCF